MIPIFVSSSAVNVWEINVITFFATWAEFIIFLRIASFSSSKSLTGGDVLVGAKI
jgi:hypothetical protein